MTGGGGEGWGEGGAVNVGGGGMDGGEGVNLKPAHIYNYRQAWGQKTIKK